MEARPTTLSVRLLWPFLRVAGVDPLVVEEFAAAGLCPADFANPDARMPQRLALDALASYVKRTGDVTVGLRAGAAVEATDLDPVERAARTGTNLRSAVQLFARHVRFLHDEAEISLNERGAEAVWRFHTKGVAHTPAADDFILACASTFVRRRTGIHEPPVEVHLVHPQPSYVSAYEEVFRTRVRFAMPHVGFVLRRESLDWAIRSAQPRYDTVEPRVRRAGRVPGSALRDFVAVFIVAQLPSGGPSMSDVARALDISVATLRRRLERQGTSFGRIVHEMRRASAERLLLDERVSIRQIADRLGFAHEPAFYAAFRRWTGATPAAYRAHVLGAGAASVPCAPAPSFTISVQS